MFGITSFRWVKSVVSLNTVIISWDADTSQDAIVTSRDITLLRSGIPINLDFGQLPGGKHPK